MKVVYRTKYGAPDVLHLTEITKPEPKEDEILIKVYASSLNSADWRMLRAKPWFIRLMGEGVFKPKRKVLGIDVAGVIEAVGKNIGKFKVGDEVFGEIDHGGLAEYAIAKESQITHKPKNFSFEESTALGVAAITALQGLRTHGEIQKGMNVLINGAGGGVGSFAVQIAKAFDTQVTAVTKTSKTDKVRSLGADNVVDYKIEDVTKNGKQYNLILDAGAYRSVYDYKNSLTPNGRYVLVGGKMIELFKLMLFGGKKFKGYLSQVNVEDLDFLKDLAGAGKVKPLIDKAFSLEQAPEAFEYLESGDVCGKVVITI